MHGRERRSSGVRGSVSKPGGVRDGVSRGHGGYGPGLPADGGSRRQGGEGEAQEHGGLGACGAARTKGSDEV